MKKIFILPFLLLFFSCSNSQSYNNSLKIPEASGICYSENNNIFFVINDEWNIYEIDKNLNILKNKYIWDYDFESIECMKNEFLMTNEKTWKILKIDNNFNILNKYKINWYKLEKKWIEWFAKVSNKKYVISTQSKKEDNLLFIEFKDNKFKVIKKINLKYKDLSWLTFYEWFLYIISDKNDLILKYDLELNKIIQEIKLKKWAWEGISFDKNWDIFLADDDWRVVKIKNNKK